jgi:ribonucleoside-diphosphate reductase beta chain
MNIKPTSYYNVNGIESLDESIYSIEPNGIGFMDFNRSKYQWAKNIYDQMLAMFWTPGEVNTTLDAKAYQLMNENEKNVYNKVFAQLSLNDALQAKYLVDFQQKVNNNVLKGTLIKQSEMEVLHSNSYSVLFDMTGINNEIFDLHKNDNALQEKNEAIATQFARYINGNTDRELLLSATASVALEGIYFLTGFGYIFTLGDKVPGARDMIQFISKDELTTHLTLFKNIYKTLLSENKYTTKDIDDTINIITEAVDIELKYALDIYKKHPILGINEQILEDTVKNFANDRLKAIGLEPVYASKPETNMQKLVLKNLKANDRRSNFFESNVSNYSRNSIDLDDF